MSISTTPPPPPAGREPAEHDLAPAGYEPRVHDTVVDVRSGRTGRVVDRIGTRIYVRPAGGGREWTARPGDLRPASPVTAGMSTPDALLLLPLPDGLSEAQREGHVCVWGGESLTVATALRLGDRPIDGAMAFPRACRADVLVQGVVALFAHAADRTQCTGGEGCDTCLALNRVIRLGRR